MNHFFNYLVIFWFPVRLCCLGLYLRCGGVAASSEVDPALSDWCAKPAGRGADNAAPLRGRLQSGLQHLQSCIPAEEQSQSHLSANSTSRGSLPGGTLIPSTLTHQSLLENSRTGLKKFIVHLTYRISCLHTEIQWALSNGTQLPKCLLEGNSFSQDVSKFSGRVVWRSDWPLSKLISQQPSLQCIARSRTGSGQPEKETPAAYSPAGWGAAALRGGGESASSREQDLCLIMPNNCAPTRGDTKQKACPTRQKCTKKLSERAVCVFSNMYLL